MSKERREMTRKKESRHFSQKFIRTVDLSRNKAINKNLETALRATLDEFSRLFKGPPPAGVRPIHVLYDPNQPRTNSHSDTSIYQIFLNVDAQVEPYNKVVFQFGHELCHVFSEPRRTNWFIESCCEMMSLTMLDRMSRVWVKKGPPHMPYKEKFLYAFTFKKYARERVQEASNDLLGKETPGLTEKLAWFETVKPTLIPNPTDRVRNTIIATMLLPIFEKSAENWDALRFLGKACIPPPTDLADWRDNSEFKFKLWLEAVPPELKDLVESISTIIGERWTSS